MTEPELTPELARRIFGRTPDPKSDSQGGDQAPADRPPATEPGAASPPASEPEQGTTPTPKCASSTAACSRRRLTPKPRALSGGRSTPGKRGRGNGMTEPRAEDLYRAAVAPAPAVLDPAPQPGPVHFDGGARTAPPIPRDPFASPEAYREAGGWISIDLE
jgi:hypothetical protein